MANYDDQNIVLDIHSDDKSLPTDFGQDIFNLNMDTNNCLEHYKGGINLYVSN